MNARLVLATLLLTLAACSQEDAPSDEVQQVAEKAVLAAEGEPARQASAYAPRNDCTEMPGAAQFLRDLNDAVARRDEDALAALAAEDIKLDFGDGAGIAELRRRVSAPGGGLWEELEQLVTLGCASNSQGGLTVPWYFEQQIPVADPLGGFMVTGTDVPMRRAPESDAPVVARLDWAAVDLVPGEAEHAGFRHVRAVPPPGEGEDSVGGLRPDPPSGYVAQGQLRSMVDYRLTAASRNGRWRIISFVSGD